METRRKKNVEIPIKWTRVEEDEDITVAVGEDFVNLTISIDPKKYISGGELRGVRIFIADDPQEADAAEANGEVEWVLRRKRLE